MPISRRRLLVSGAAAAAVVGGGAVFTAKRLDTVGLMEEHNEFYTSLPIPKMLDARALQNRIALTAQAGRAEFLPNFEADTLGYSAPYLGPVIRVYRGDTVTMTVTNVMDKVTTVHWHGLFVPSELDGGPYGVIDPGQIWQPSLKIDQPAATAWYHPHPHGDTARQVYKGLAGLIYVEDGSSADLGLPGRYGLDDLPLILQDRTIGPEGELIYDDSPMAVMHGSRGDTIVVNGAIGPVAEVPKSIVRLRLLNGANARNFRLTFDDDRDFHVIANDSGFLAAPVVLTELTIAPGERFEVLVDFSNGRVTSLLTYPDRNGQYGSSLSDTIKAMVRNVTDIPTPIVRFDPTEDISPAVKSLPARLVELPGVVPSPGATRRAFILDNMSASNMAMTGETGSMDDMDHSQMGGMSGMGGTSGLAMGMKMGINGKTFDAARIDVETRLGASEIWELRSTEMAHPFHIHGASFRILSMDGAAPLPHLSGRKDTLLVNESAEVLVTFDQPADPAKPFMFHCHILEHEDAGMMGQYIAV
ncbi:MAG: multicopper oxidase domain-containing protein [Aestuariivirga sp.]